ncbi:hypothetical protein LEP1GSC103_3593 [Leptospira borgpetersenii serovar Javanica str. UI 09931]|uniref:Uncharacterized protein n=2 Tax=Leptospira borgpetersenii TaxID=174 RepID=M6W2D0_LEPBO|nr:hypothetical protein LEP1GSC133_0205 [Leptospira borgpetersenii serovar Pomona str. 200901868]EPG59329.1 hypothetical protein LEP1GSC103_3593 [Leptospira borgpetersenii serovar Javanica str. UI 09931]
MESKFTVLNFIVSFNTNFSKEQSYLNHFLFKRRRRRRFLEKRL